MFGTEMPVAEFSQESVSLKSDSLDILRTIDNIRFNFLEKNIPPNDTRPR